jgi:hypothetical protein
MMSTRSKRCTAVRADGDPCRAWAVRGSDPPRCGVHSGTDAPIGAPLGNANALKHGAYADPSTLRRLAADIPDDDVAELDEFFLPGGLDRGRLRDLEGWSIEVLIIDVSLKLAILSRYIHAHMEDLTVEQLGGLLRIHGQNASRLGRLLRERRAITGETGGHLEEALNRALDQLSAELGVDL